MSAFINEHRVRFGVEPICREIEVSASAYWARKTRPPSLRAQRDEYLLEAIGRVHAASAGVYGQLKVWDELRGENITVARCTVERLMRASGIQGLCNGLVTRTTLPGLSPVAADDLVRRNFTAERPDPYGFPTSRISAPGRAGVTSRSSSTSTPDGSWAGSSPATCARAW